MRYDIETIDAKRASQYLAMNTRNRMITWKQVRKFERDMREGNWTQCADPITFCEDGTLVSGQHRLLAILHTRIPQTFIVVRDMSRAAALNADGQRPRNLVDNAKISGVGEGINKLLLGVVRAVEFGTPPNHNLVSNAQHLALVEKHRGAAHWALKNGPKGKSVRMVVTLAAVARAWYVETDTDKLARFGTVMSLGGVPEGQAESAALTMREYVRERTMHSSIWRDTFFKTQNAISYFMRGKPLTVVKGIATEAYPLPTRLKPQSDELQFGS